MGALSPEVRITESRPNFESKRKRAAFERRAGMSLIFADGIERYRVVVYDRAEDRYEKTILNPDGTPYYDVSEPLSKHTGYGSAKETRSMEREAQHSTRIAWDIDLEHVHPGDGSTAPMVEVDLEMRPLDQARPDLVADQSRTFRCACGETVILDFTMNMQSKLDGEQLRGKVSMVAPAKEDSGTSRESVGE